MRKWQAGRDWSVAVVRASISRKDLERIALQELRSFPGAEHVISVEIEGQSDQASDVNWTLLVTAKEGGNLERIQYAARTTSDRLKRRYSVQVDPRH